jgi:putative two-component system response regulator
MTADEERGRRILVVDDNPFIASLLQHGLTAEGFRVSTAQDGLEAIASVASDPPDLIVLDLDLPHVPGDEICRRLKGNPATRLIPIVMVTALGAIHNKLAGWDYGADDFLTKPFHLVEVTTRCRSLLRIKRLVEERDSAEAVVFALARAVEAKSTYTQGHSARVTHYCLELAAALGLPAEQHEVLRKGAQLHDIGKISIPDAILNKPGPLTPDEFAVVKEHSAQGAHIVEPLHSVRDAVPLVRWHHERLDGKGYPDGLRGEQIPLLVRILSVCDVYDSLSSDRPYRAPIPHDVCLEMLQENAQGGGLDPRLVALFTEIASKVTQVRPTWGGPHGQLQGAAHEA